MRFTPSALILAALAAIAHGQGLAFIQPSSGQILTAGNSFSIELGHHSFIDNINYIAAGITLNSSDTDFFFIGGGLLTSATAVQPVNGYVGVNQFDVTLPSNVPAGSYWLQAQSLALAGIVLDGGVTDSTVSVQVIAQ